jgi:hypothetical protein
MQTDPALSNPSYLRVICAGLLQLILVLAYAWFGTRQRRADFRFFRVIRLTLLCLASSLPFACIAYWLWPWNFESWWLQANLFLMVFSPIITGLAIGFLKKRMMLKRKRTYSVPGSPPA